MYQSHHQASYTEFSYYPPPPIPSIPPSNSNPINPLPHYSSISSDPSYPPTHLSYHDSSHYPSNVSGSEIQSGYYQDLNPSWVVKEAPPTRYSSAIQPLNVEAIAPTSYAIAPTNYAIAPTNYDTSLTSIRPRVRENPFSNYPRKLKRPKTKTIPKKLTAAQKVRCELCKIECTHIQLYEKHLSGKMHTKNLQKIYASGTTNSSFINKSSSGEHSTQGGQGIVPPVALETKKQKLLEAGAAVQSVKVCTVCNVACNGEIAFADHLAGKKHMALVRANTVSVSNPEPNSLEKKAKTKNDGSVTVWCEVCKISCTSRDGLNVHRRGKKHKKNLEKLQNSVKDTNAPGPQENAESKQVKKKKVRSKEITTEDVETKKRKVLECGAAADAVRTCAVCNVVCNSDTVFKSHLAGHKHATMVKQAEAGNVMPATTAAT